MHVRQLVVVITIMEDDLFHNFLMRQENFAESAAVELLERFWDGGSTTENDA